jgi:hypothetical protein
MPEGKPTPASPSVRARASEFFRAVRRHWGLFAAAAALCVLAGWLASWGFLSRQLDRLQGENAVLVERIEALASTPPSQWRRLNDRARGLLLAGLQHPDNKFTLLVIYATADSESRQYAAQFVDAARLVGIDARTREAALTASSDTGLVVASATAAPSEQAEKLKDILSSAGLDVRTASWAKSPADALLPVDFALFVGPKPW